MIGALAARNNLRVKNARQPVKRKMFKCLGQGHKILSADRCWFTGQLLRRRKLKSSWALILTELVAEALEFPASDWRVIDYNT